MEIYDELLKAGVKLDSHESDLYALVTPESQAIVQKYADKIICHTFRSKVDKQLWFDIPFSYKPFWEKKQKEKEQNNLVTPESRAIVQKYVEWKERKYGK